MMPNLRGVSLMTYPPSWGIFPPRHMTTRLPGAGHRNGGNRRPGPSWRRLFRTFVAKARQRAALKTCWPATTRRLPFTALKAFKPKEAAGQHLVTHNNIDRPGRE